MRNGERKSSRKEVLGHQKTERGFIVFVETFAEDDKEVLTVKLIQLERLNVKFEALKEEIFTSVTDGEFDNFDVKITTCNKHIQKLETQKVSLRNDLEEYRHS
ncbi:hypothetical protein TNIN_311461 [Trichonephila inaurata madagascariensis]|uniref:Uncharacterized protein n=1 Tax=Trichonephila inaurata madagascariensis TaxID=2747483 RepID=A0A8X7BZK4_9ARAC|nr:hypothetical protein TNIN_311461 [Trichonephila inaurata madagascariensis]